MIELLCLAAMFCQPKMSRYRIGRLRAQGHSEAREYCPANRNFGTELECSSRYAQNVFRSFSQTVRRGIPREVEYHPFFHEAPGCGSEKRSSDKKDLRGMSRLRQRPADRDWLRRSRGHRRRSDHYSQRAQTLAPAEPEATPLAYLTAGRRSHRSAER